MDMTSTATAPRSPLGRFLRERIDQVVATWETADATAVSRPSRETLQRFLDAIDEVAAAAKDIVDEKSATAGATQRRCVLIATDDAPFGATVQRVTGPDYDVNVVDTPESALQSAFSRTPDVVVSSGAFAVEAVRRLREVQPGLPAVVAASDRDVSRLASAFTGEPVVLLRTPGGDAVALAIGALLDARKFRPAATTPERRDPVWDAAGEPRSYGHLAGLLPRALERAVDFDVGAGVIAHPGTDPVVDVYARSDCAAETLDRVREHAFALFRLVAGGSPGADVSALTAAPAPLRSWIYVPLATQGRVVGLTYLASFQPDAFSAEHTRVLAALATYASAGYRNVEASLAE